MCMFGTIKLYMDESMKGSDINLLFFNLHGKSVSCVTDLRFLKRIGLLKSYKEMAEGYEGKEIFVLSDSQLESNTEHEVQFSDSV